MKKKIIGLLLCVLVVASLVGSVSANGMSGNGYTSHSIYYGDMLYPLVMTSKYDPNEGAYISVGCDARLTVMFDDVRVVYKTKNYGYVTDLGGAVRAELVPGVRTVYSGKVPCSMGMPQVVRYDDIQGSACIISDKNTYTTSVHGWYVELP